MYADDKVGIPCLKFNEQSERLARILKMLYVKFGVDFNLYKPNTIQRRIEKYLEESQGEMDDDFLAKLELDEQEQQTLFQSILINVTEFFRDPGAFAKLKDSVIEDILTKTSETEEVRIWVPACASGEEAYSIAIALDEKMRELKITRSIKIFATDIDPGALDSASAGVYALERLHRLSKARLERYFTPLRDQFKISKEIRKMVIFANHNLIKDPPFTKLDFISCRNLLIYLQAKAQRRIINYFLFSLKIHGYLFLGASEDLNHRDNAFKIVDKSVRIFQKISSVSLSPAQYQRIEEHKNTDVMLEQKTGHDKMQLLASYAEILCKVLPPSVLVNEKRELIQIFGDVSAYFRLLPGKASLDITTMVNKNLKAILSASFHRSVANNKVEQYSGISFEQNNKKLVLTIRVQPIYVVDKNFYLVSILEDKGNILFAADTNVDLDTIDEHTSAQVIELEEALAYAREQLQTTVEELESSNEELQSTNEELMASNEELQSTNEELHSVNEELFTVNGEYQHKIDELEQAREDINNLLSTSQIGTIFLDENLRIRLFTSEVARLFGLINEDIGRSIKQFNNPFLTTSFFDKLQQSTAEQRVIRQELEVDENWYHVTITPYQSEQGASKDIVVSITNITDIKKMDE